MSRKATPKRQPRAKQKGSKRGERYLQPSILLALKLKPSYGYELIQEISQFGFIEGQAPPGMIYRHLRDLEEDGLVASEWITQETGPAKRVYEITEEGLAVLDHWIGYMQKQAETLLAFVARYQDS